MGKVFTKENLVSLTNQNTVSSEFIIPDEFDEIGENAFCGSKFSKVIIPAKIKKIGKNAFNHCIYLKQVEFLNNSQLEEIGEGAFSRSGLTEIEIPSSVKEIGKHAFYYTKLKKVKFSKDSVLNKIGGHAFGISDLTEIEIPSTVEEIGEWAFYGCRKLEQVRFQADSRLKKIFDYAFSECRLSEISFPSSVIEIGNDAFGGNRFKTIKIPSNVKKIGDRAFWCCSIEQVYFDEYSELEEIGKAAFSDNKLTEIALPSMIKKVSDSSFSQNKVKKIMVGDKLLAEYEFYGICNTDRKVRQLNISINNNDFELAVNCINGFNYADYLNIEYSDYEKLCKFIAKLKPGVYCYSVIRLSGKKISLMEKMNIRTKLRETISNSKTTIIFERVNVTEENKLISDNQMETYPMANKELIIKIKNTCNKLSGEVRSAFERRLSSIVILYNKKREEAKPNLINYFSNYDSSPVDLSIDENLEQWLYGNLLQIEMDLTRYDNIIFDLERLNNCRKLFDLKVENKPKELFNIEDIILNILYLKCNVDDDKKDEIDRYLSAFLTETENIYNIKLQEMYDRDNDTKVVLDVDYTLEMDKLKKKLLEYLEQLSKYEEKVRPYVLLLDSLKVEKVLEYELKDGSIVDTILGIKYIITLIKNQTIKEQIEQEISFICDEFISKIKNVFTKVDKVNEQDYLKLEMELRQKLQPILEKVNFGINRNDYVSQLINCRDMLKSNGELVLDSKKAIESYVAETYDLILKLPSKEQPLAQQRLLFVLEKWIDNMSNRKANLDLLREIYKDISEINFNLREYLNAVVNYDRKK